MKPPEEVRREFVRQWLDKAEADFGVAKQLIAANTPYPAVAAFHCQQAAEKYLKAFLVEHEIEFPKTHNIAELRHLVATVNAGMAAALKESVTLTPYSVDTRYPGDVPEVSAGATCTALGLAEKVRTAVLTTLAQK